jgi:(E)-4-hydroxy-3-methylbut-2-enyl-diphosphate synthase
MMKRKKTKKIYVGNVAVGGDSPITVQSMTNTKTSDVEATVAQIKQLESRKCDIIRVAVPDEEAVKAIPKIKKRINIPLIADIHFNYQLAIESIRKGADGIRINPGNIGSKEKLIKIVKEAMQANVPIRIGVNSGSLEKNILKKYGKPSAEAMVESAMRSIELFEKMGFFNFKISLKSSDVMTTIQSYRLISDKTQYPLHVGVTEAGSYNDGVIKSSIGIGSLLSQGIGDTIRVSLTSDPMKEVIVGNKILKTLGLRDYGVDIISCPTCGRCSLNIEGIVERVSRQTEGIRKPIKVAIMGCVVNGPGEAREADVGIAGGEGYGVIFKRGKIIKKVREEEIVDSLMKEIQSMV